MKEAFSPHISELFSVNKSLLEGKKSNELEYLVSAAY